MKLRFAKVVTLLTSVLSCGLAASQSITALTGRVVDNLQHSTPNLQVRLRPPVNSRLAGQIALTDGNGAFSFPKVQGGSYLLEVSQGPYLLYRQALSAPSASLNITVQRR